MSLSKTPPQERPWRTASLVHISRWRLDCPSSQVWELLASPEHWPSPLGYSCTVRSQITRREQDAQGRGEIESRAQGCFQGMGLWVIEPSAPRQVDITYRWEVSLHKPWMRWFAPVLRGVLSWNHFNVMQAGAQGMARQLGCHSPLVSNWSGGAR